LIRKVLKLLEKGGNTETLVRKLDLSRKTLDAILETAINKGYLKKTEICNDCSSCPLGENCNRENPKEEAVKMYALTPKGREYIENNI